MKPVPSALLVAALGIASCGPEPTLEPPEIHYGMAVCEVCGMIVSDERYAAAVVMIENGRSRFIALDDLGELPQFNAPEGVPARAYVHDQPTLEWVAADEATYLRSDNLRTPMAMGFAAFSTRESADGARERLGGEVMDFEAFRNALLGG